MSKRDMDSSANLEQNWDALSMQMNLLKPFMEEMTRTKAQKMVSWLKDVGEKEKNYGALDAKFSKFKDGSFKEGRKLLFWSGAVERRTLNDQVVDMLRSVRTLIEEGHAHSNSIGTLLSYLAGENPKQFTEADLNRFTFKFSSKIHPDDPDCNVYNGQFHNGMKIAVKHLTETDAVESIFTAEMNTMFRTSHRNLVQFYGFCFEKNMKALVFEYMPKGSLDRILFDPQHENIEWEKLYYIATGTAKGISYLHDGCVSQLLHRNLKPSSVLLDSDMCPKITNFGVSKMMDRVKTHITKSNVSWDSSYAAPEMTPSSHITDKCDVYSFGMILFEVLARKRNTDIKEGVYFPRFIWNGFKEGRLEEIIKKCGISEKNSETALILCIVALWCIQITPENRPSMNIVVKMLEKEIKVAKPLDPFTPLALLPWKPFVNVAYDPSDFAQN